MIGCHCTKISSKSTLLYTKMNGKFLFRSSTKIAGKSASLHGFNTQLLVPLVIRYNWSSPWFKPIYETKRNSTDNVLAEFKYSLQDMFKMCMWQMQEVNCSEIIQMVPTDAGKLTLLMLEVSKYF